MGSTRNERANGVAASQVTGILAQREVFAFDVQDGKGYRVIQVIVVKGEKERCFTHCTGG